MNDFTRPFCLILCVSLVALGASAWLEIFSRIEPCYFCKAQRFCYFLMALLAVIGLFFKAKKAIAIFLLLISLSNLTIASYQLGIQFGFFADVCAVVSPVTLHDFKNVLFQKQQTQHPCSSITWVLGLPVVAWSALFSFACFAKIALFLKQKSSTPTSQGID